METGQSEAAPSSPHILLPFQQKEKAGGWGGQWGAVKNHTVGACQKRLPAFCSAYPGKRKRREAAFLERC